MRAVAAALCLTAVAGVSGCGDDDDAGDDDPGATTTVVELSPEEAAFCDGLAALAQRTDSDPDYAADREGVVRDLQALDPPDEIADAWQTTLAAAELSAQVASGDAGPDASSDLAEMESEFAQSDMTVATYVGQTCGLDLFGETVPSSTGG